MVCLELSNQWIGCTVVVVGGRLLNFFNFE